MTYFTCFKVISPLKFENSLLFFMLNKPAIFNRVEYRVIRGKVNYRVNT